MAVTQVLTSSFDLRLAKHACSALQAYALWDAATVTAGKTKLMDEMVTLAIQLVRGYDKDDAHASALEPHPLRRSYALQLRLI